MVGMITHDNTLNLKFLKHTNVSTRVGFFGNILNTESIHQKWILKLQIIK
jgi:hypothetical protein